MCAPQPIRFGVARDWLESATFYISIYLLQSVSRIMSPSLQLHINSETVSLTAILFKATQIFAVVFHVFSSFLTRATMPPKSFKTPSKGAKNVVKTSKGVAGEGKRKRRRKETYAIYIYKVLRNT